jgi:hypothetical protein
MLLHLRSNLSIPTAIAGALGCKTLFGIVGTQHDDKQIHRLVAHKAGVDRLYSGHALVQRVREHGCPTGKPLLQHQIVLAETLLQQTGPALVFVKAVTTVGAVVWVCAVAVGVGITKTDDVLFHFAFSFL